MKNEIHNIFAQHKLKVSFIHWSIWIMSFQVVQQILFETFPSNKPGYIFQHHTRVRYTAKSGASQISRSISFINPNSIRSYKIVQKLSPKHAARGVAQSPYPIYRHRKASLSEQPPWRAGGDPRLAHGRSRARALGPAGALLFFLHPPFLPPSGDRFFTPAPPNPRLG